MRPDSDSPAYVGLINPQGSEVYKPKQLSQPFGGGRSPANWGVVFTFIQSQAILFSLATGAYVSEVCALFGIRVGKSGSPHSIQCAYYCDLQLRIGKAARQAQICI